MALENTLAVALQDDDAGLEAAGGMTIPCKVASAVWQDAQERYERYSTLMFWLTVVAAVIVVAAIFIFIFVDEAKAGAIVTFAAGVFDGVLVLQIKGERDKAESTRTAAQNIVNDKCDGVAPEQVAQSLTA